MSDKIDYEALGEIQDGGGAANGFVEAIHAETTPERKAELETKLLRYCEVDTEAMAEIVDYFRGLDE
jgi:hypothetical protein